MISSDRPDGSPQTELVGDEVQVVAKGGGPSPWILAVVVLVAVGAFGWLGRSSSQAESDSGLAPTSDPASGLPGEQQTPGNISNAGQPSTGSEVVVDATDMADQALGPELAAKAILAISHPGAGLDLHPLDGSPSESLDVREVPEGGGLGVVDGGLTYIGGGQAWVVSLEDGEDPVALGPADLVYSTGASDRIWLGAFHGESNQLRSYAWREVDLANTTLRTAIRQEPLEFPSPGLVWGFNSSVWRLIDDERRPWRLVAHGYPVAAGHNDVIIKICDSQQICSRAWFDANTGERQDPVLDDVAELLPIDNSGKLSPDGRYVAKSLPGGGPTQIYSVTGRLITDECLDIETLSWLVDVGLLACRTGQGVSIFDLATGANNELALANSPSGADGLPSSNSNSDTSRDVGYEFVLVGR